MFSPKRTALYLAVSAMAFAAGEASAGCKYIPNPPGSLVCAAWIKGSEVCQITTTGQTTGSVLVSGTCSITGDIFIDGAEGASGTTGAFCASGAYPPGFCTPGKPAPTETAFSSNITKGAAPSGAAPASAHAPQPCLPPPSRPTKAGPLNQCLPGIIVPGGDGFLDEDLSTPVCHPDALDSSLTDCSASAEILPPAGSTCPNGKPAVDFTASAMLAIVEVTVCSGTSSCDTEKIYEFCTVDPTAPDGTPYTCVDISDQGSRCDSPSGNPLTFDPDDPMCGQARSCIL